MNSQNYPPQKVPVEEGVHSNSRRRYSVPWSVALLLRCEKPLLFAAIRGPSMETPPPPTPPSVQTPNGLGGQPLSYLPM